MKKYLFFILAIFVLSSCDWIETVINSNDSGSIKGTTDIPINAVGNTFATSVQVGATPYSANSSITITELDEGIATIHIVSSLPGSVSNLIPSKYKDSSGKLVYDLNVKMTDKGILDYTNKDHEPFVLVKYDAEVGDEYKLKKSDGKTITREVVRKSSDDDYFWGGMIIKTIDVEQDSRIPGVSKIEYFANHKFGLVGIRFYMEDGTTSQVNLYPSTY